jgi:hypothetical protein
MYVVYPALKAMTALFSFNAGTQQLASSGPPVPALKIMIDLRPLITLIRDLLLVICL